LTVARKGKGAQQRKRAGIKFFQGSMDEYVRVQKSGIANDWLVVIALVGASRMFSVPYKNYAHLMQAALIAFGRDNCEKYLDGEYVSSQQAEATSEAAPEVDAAEC
jgi:hypothetical protein